MAVASLQPIYERLNGADSYHPFAANTFADWSIEAGDIVNLKRGSDTYISPVHTSHLSWKGSPQISMQTRGNKQLDSIGKVTQKKFARNGGAYRAAQTVGKKATVFFQKPDPQLTSGDGININDVWIESDMLNSWEDIGELTWEELADYTWMDFYGSKMYAWDGTKWVQIADEQKENYNFDLLRNTPAELTSIKADLSGAYSKILQTKSEIRLEVVDTKNGLQSLISQTAGQIRSEVSDTVNNVQSSITEQADRISLVVEGTGSNAHIRPAEIVASINNGASSILLSADHIKLDAGGSFKLGDAFSISLGALMLKTTMFCNANLSIEEGHSIGFADGSLFLTGSDLATTIKSASVSGNTLTLTPYSGNPITFSKATTLDSSWSGSVLTLSAKQNNTSVATREVGIGGSYGDHDIDLIVDQNGTIAHGSGATAIIPIKVAQLQGGGASTNRYTKSLLVDMSSLLTTGSYNTSGTKTPGSGYIGFSSVTFTIPNASGFARSSSYNTQNSNQVGSISKSGLSGNEYLYWTVGGKKYHIVVNT